MATAVTIAPTPILAFLNNQGQPCVGGSVLTQVGGVNTTTYQDSAGTIPLPNPIPLNNRGEISNAAGISCQLFLPTGVVYVFTLIDAQGNLLNQASYVATSSTVSPASLAAVTGANLIGFSQSSTYSPGTVGLALQSMVNIMNSPYNAKGDGTTDDTAAFIAALATGKDVFVPNGTYKCTSSLTMSTSQQQILGAGRLSVLQFVMTAATPAIIFTGASGRQRVTGLTITASNCPKLFSFQSAQVQVLFNWLTNTTAGGIVCYLEDENTGASLYSFGAMIGYNFIHGSFTTGSRGVRCGLNSQTTQIFSNTIDFFETAISVERNTDSMIIHGNVLETLMSTGYGVDMRSVASTSQYSAVTITGNHFEDLYGAVAWGTTGGTGATYTSCQIHGNFFNGYSGGTNYFLTVGATCGAGSTNNRVEFNSVSQNLTSFFNLIDQAGAASLAGTKGNTLGSGTFATGTNSAYAYTIREHNSYYAIGLTSGTIFAAGVQRQEVRIVTFTTPLRWDPHEYLESVQFRYVSTGSTPSVTMNLHQVNPLLDTDTVMFTTGSITANGVVTLAVNTTALPSLHYYIEFICALGGGTTAYVYPAQAYLRQ